MICWEEMVVVSQEHHSGMAVMVQTTVLEPKQELPLNRLQVEASDLMVLVLTTMAVMAVLAAMVGSAVMVPKLMVLVMMIKADLVDLDMC